MVGGTKGDVLRYVCGQLGVVAPSTWPERYELLRSWAAKDQPPARPKVKAVVSALGIQFRTVKSSKKAGRKASDDFLLSYEWRRLRMEVIVERGARCECCGATPKDNGIVINVDHIKPRKLYPALALEKSNLQILCDVCNHGKGNWNETDWREPEPEPMKPRLVKPA